MKTANLSIVENRFAGEKPHEATFTILTLDDGSTAPLGRFEIMAVESKEAAIDWANSNDVKIV